MMMILILLVLTAASIAYLVMGPQRTEAAFCKMECIEHQAKAPRNY